MGIENSSNLVETTPTWYGQRTFIPAMGVTFDDLTDEEKRIVYDSVKYEKELLLGNRDNIIDNIKNNINEILKSCELSAEVREKLEKWSDI